MPVQQEVNEIAELLSSEGQLFDLDIGRWAAQKKLRPQDVLLDNINPDALHMGHKKLLPKEALASLANIEGQARRELERRSLPFYLSGARYVYKNTIPELLIKMNELRQSYFREIDVLAQNYPAYRESQLSVLDRQIDTLVNNELNKYGTLTRAAKQAELSTWAELEKSKNRTYYLKVEELKERFNFTWRMIRVPEFGGVEDILSAEMVEQAHSQLKQDLDAWVRDAAAEMHRQLGQAAAQAHDQLKKNGKLNPKNLRPLFSAFETFKAVDFTGASQFRTSIENIQAQFARMGGDVDYERTADALLNNPGSLEAFGNMLSDLSRLAVEDTAKEAGITALGKAGKFGRVLKLD